MNIMIKIKTSYFYQIRNFTPNLIPVSTCLRDPNWYRPPQGEEYYRDKRNRQARIAKERVEKALQKSEEINNEYLK